MYVAVKGGEAAIDAAHAQLAVLRRGDRACAALSLAQIRDQMALAVARVMAEGSLFDPDLAALALKQAWGDVAEAIFLVRAYRTTLPRLAVSRPIETRAMLVRRRISATYKDLPGGQVLGPTFDYTHRLLDFALAAEDGGEPAPVPPTAPEPLVADMPRVADILDADDLIEAETDPDADTPGAPVPDLTREPLTFPADRAMRLQGLARGDEGFLLSLAYSSQRGHGATHPFAGEIRMGEVEIEIVPEDLGFAVTIGAITVTECQMVNQFQGSRTTPPQFTRGYGLVFGFAERKAMAMSLLDRAMRAPELGEPVVAPAQDEEFVLSHADVVEASGFVQHLKLPHYVDFQAELETVRRLRRDARARTGGHGGDRA